MIDFKLLNGSTWRLILRDVSLVVLGGCRVILFSIFLASRLVRFDCGGGPITKIGCYRRDSKNFLIIIILIFYVNLNSSLVISSY